MADKRRSAAARRQRVDGGTRDTGAASGTVRTGSWRVWLTGAVVVVFALLVALNLVALLRIVAFPVDASVGEGVIQYEAMRLARGLPIYKPVDQPPYWISTYPPLFQAVASLVGGGATLWWPRVVSLASSLWCALALWLMVGRITASRAAGFIAAAVWILSPKLDTWGALARVDMLGRAMETAAVFLAWRWGRDNRALAAAAVFATLAMATKQTMVAGGGTVAMMLWFSGERRRAAVFVGAWVGATALVYAALNLATGGWFWDNVFARTARAYDLRILVEWATAFFLTHTGALVAVAAGFAWVIAAHRASARRAHRQAPVVTPVEWDADWRVFGWAMIAAVPTMLLAGNDGVDINYFIDGAWALAGLAGIGFAAALRAPFWMPATVAGAALVLNAPGHRPHAVADCHAGGALAPDRGRASPCGCARTHRVHQLRNRGRQRAVLSAVPVRQAGGARRVGSGAPRRAHPQ